MTRLKQIERVRADSEAAMLRPIRPTPILATPFSGEAPTLVPAPRVPAVRPLDAELWRILAPGYVPTVEEWRYVEQREREGAE